MSHDGAQIAASTRSLALGGTRSLAPGPVTESAVSTACMKQGDGLDDYVVKRRSPGEEQAPALNAPC